MFDSFPFRLLFLIGTCFSFLLDFILEYSCHINRKKKGDKVPVELFGYVDSKVLKKTCSYKNDKFFLYVPTHIVFFVLELVLVFSGFYPFVFGKLYAATANIYLTVILFTIIVSLPSKILSLPFDIYDEFVIEKKYGFSNMTAGLWILDGLKGLVLSLVVSVPLLLLAVFFLCTFENIWWLLLAVVYIAFSLGISFLYPVLIAPLFNKFSPLESLGLKSRLESLLGRTGFESKGIFVMDASKRSGHSNAYFTGFGKNKRVVLYDTLIRQLTDDEIESVLGHELGHYKLHHITKRMCFVLPMVVVLMFVLSLFIKTPALYTDFGFAPETAQVNGKDIVLPYIRYIGLFLLPMVFGGFSPVFSLVSNFFSRKDEFAADKYSASLCGRSRSLSTALIKLNKENLSEVTPPKLYSVFNYSHPPLLERIKALESLEEKSQN